MNMAATSNFDADIRKAFLELQAKVVTTTQQVKLAEVQIAQVGISLTQDRLTRICRLYLAIRERINLLTDVYVGTN